MRKLILLFLIPFMLSAWSGRFVLDSCWIKDTTVTDTFYWRSKNEKGWDLFLLSYFVNVYGTIAEDPDTMIFTLDGWLIDSSNAYEKINIFTNTHLIAADTHLYFDTIPDLYLKNCDIFLFQIATIGDTMGFEPDSIKIKTYGHRNR